MKFTTVVATILSMAAFAIAAPIANEGTFFLLLFTHKVPLLRGRTEELTQTDRSRRPPEPRHVRQLDWRRSHPDPRLLEM